MGGKSSGRLRALVGIQVGTPLMPRRRFCPLGTHPKVQNVHMPHGKRRLGIKISTSKGGTQCRSLGRKEPSTLARRVMPHRENGEPLQRSLTRVLDE